MEIYSSNVLSVSLSTLPLNVAHCARQHVLSLYFRFVIIIVIDSIRTIIRIFIKCYINYHLLKFKFLLVVAQQTVTSIEK